MKKLFLVLIFLFLFLPNANAVLIDITDPVLTHFGDFDNHNYPADYSKISADFTIDGNGGDFGWHYSPSNHGSAIGGILLDENFAVTSLSFEIHTNPFKDFYLQGSTDTTTGFDGSWDTILSSTVTERTELEVQSWNFSNNTAYSSYRINVLNDYTADWGVPAGWAMYRWKLLADDGTNAVPEPTSMALFSLGLLGVVRLRRKR